MKSVVPRRNGDIYQDRAFWLKACRLLLSKSKVQHVGYEIGDVRYFDDVSVEYSETINGPRGEKIEVDYYQVKYHESQEGTISCDLLVQPSYLGAKRDSLLERLRRDFQAVSKRDMTARFNFVTTHQIRYGDPLGNLLSEREGEIRLELLFGKKVTGPMAVLREKWCDHLSVDEEELKCILASLRLCVHSFNLGRLTRELSMRLETVGLEPIDPGQRTNRYDSLIQRLYSEGKSKFSKEDLLEVLQNEGLKASTAPAPSTPVFGIRSFMKFTEHMEEDTLHMLDLVPYFEGRYIKSKELWNSEVAWKISKFVSNSVISSGNCCHIRLEAHSSIAFAVGYELDPKAGMEASVIQNSLTGRQVWDLDASSSVSDASPWVVSNIDLGSTGNELAVVLSVTHAIEGAVRKYVHAELPQIGCLKVFTIGPQVGATSIQNGVHAWQMAEEVIRQVEKSFGEGDKEGPIHIFNSSPNGLVFLLGRLARGLGPIQLYEHDFEQGTDVKYFSSISLPIQFANSEAREARQWC